MDAIRSNVLQVPGASLHYEVRGRGPLLLLIHGGGGSARSFDGIANQLAAQYTVVAYDRRGLSNSILDDPEEDQFIETHSDDAHHLLKVLLANNEKASVFGSSAGAVIGLDLVARCPEQISTLIAHEPATHQLGDADPFQELASIRETYYREGMPAVFKVLATQNIFHLDEREPDAELPEQTLEGREQNLKNLKFEFEHEFPMFDRYQFDFPALKKATDRTKIMLAGGCGREDSTYRSAAAIANELAATFVEFPGRHLGYVTHPKAFVRRLHALLSEE
ncbi:MAG TPA: alpha/beta hydrolase [Candidatus Saccharimonadales bacterium]|nr:alpha/beta hydrolase [Candidatus Saccharimonadales bacterium]